MKKISLILLSVILLGLLSGCAEITAVQMEEARARQADAAAVKAQADAEAEAARAMAAQSNALAEQAKAQTAQAEAMKDVMVSQQWANLVGILVLVLGVLVGVFMGMIGVYMASRVAIPMAPYSEYPALPPRQYRGALPPPMQIPDECQIPGHITVIRAYQRPDIESYRGQ